MVRVQPKGVAQFSHDPGGDCDRPATTVSAETAPAGDGAAPRSRGLIPALALLAAACLTLLALLVVLPAARSDPYSRSALQLSGSQERGEQLFLLNCAGCHGIAAQGLVGPNLHGVQTRKSDRQLIQQVVSGRTPPMPRFQPEPQAMADLLAYLHTLT
jgi:mono/diheme cytochrome c family protein